MQSIHTNKAPAAIGPYSQAVLRNDLLFVSGLIGSDPNNGQLRGGFEHKTHLVFANLKAILDAAGSSFTHVVQVPVYLKDVKDFAALNQIYARNFCEPYPARETIQAARISKDALIEISLIAMK